MAMNPEVKAKWVAALRSGEYKQGKNVLRCDGCWCCLGVLADIAAKDGVCSWRRDEAGDYLIGPEDGIGGFATLPPPVSEWAGIGECGEDVTINGVHTGLVQHNDYDGRSFSEIADAIEAQL